MDKISKINDGVDTYNLIPQNHASKETKYGIGNANKYGHCKIINNLDSDTFIEGEALSAYQGNILANKIKVIAGKPITYNQKPFYKFSLNELGVNDSSNAIFLGLLARGIDGNGEFDYNSEVYEIHCVDDGISIEMNSSVASVGTVALAALFYIINE